MSDFYDDLETRSADARESDLFVRLPNHLTEAVANVPGLATHLEGHDVRSVNSREALAKLPVLRKPELMEAQAANPPFGGFANESELAGNRVFMSPGPIWEPQGLGDDSWGGGRSFFAAGFRPGDVVHCAISFHMTPGGWLLDQGIEGCWLYGLSGWHRQYGNAGGGGGCLEANWLCRHAGLSQNYAR